MKQLTYKKFLCYSGFVLFITILFFHCRKNEDVITTDPYQPVYISGGVYGSVINEQGNPEPLVKVSNGNSSVMTDQNGIFILQNQSLDKAGAQIKFEKSGYFTIYKSVIPIKNKMVYTKLQLVPKILTKSIVATPGGIIPVNGNAQITIPQQSIVDASGKAYGGQVQVYAYWMDPSNDRTSLEMPGNLTGRDHDGKEVVLQTLGMLAVELEDPAGNPLNIATGKFAELKFPIPSTLDAQAKSSIPMWYYNAVKGGWIEEGNAGRQGNFYVGQVQHFSFWNCDYPFPYVNLKGHVLDASGKAIGNVNLEILNESNHQKGYGTTTADGYFSGKIPASTTYTLTFGDSVCQSTFSLKFSSSTVDIDLGDINSSLNSFYLFGSLIDCSNNPLTEGYLQIWSGSVHQSLFFLTDQNGFFSGNLVACQNQDLNYNAVDYKSFKESGKTTVTFKNQTEINLGSIKVCDALTNAIVVYVNDFPAKYVNAYAETVGTDLNIHADGELGDSSFVDLKLDLLNTPTPKDITMLYPNTYKFYLCNPCSNMNVNLNQYGAVGTQVKGTFNGTLKDAATKKDVDVHGEFSAIRRQ